jgi:hypothetical protein
MAKRIFEFYCNDCDGWILVNLNEDIRGEVVIRCPNCDREHPRNLENGEMTMPAGYGSSKTDEIKIPKGIRVGMKITRNGTKDANDVIVPMKSAYSKTSRLDNVQNQRTGGLVGTVELWLQHALGFAEGDS